MSQFLYQKIIPFSPEEVFSIFREQFYKTFPKANRKKPIGAKAQRDAKGVQGYVFQLQLEVTDYCENKIYEITTHASNKQHYSSRYELTPTDDGGTLLVLKESIITPGFFGTTNALLTQIFFKGRAKRKAERLFQSIQSELENHREK